MTTLAARAIRNYYVGNVEDYPIIAGDTIFEGAAVGENAAGFARPLQAGDVFLGFADETVNNDSGAAGDQEVLVRTRGRLDLAVVGATAVTVNDRPPVYASDDDTFTLTATANSKIGHVSRFISSGQAVVEFDAMLATAAP
jgi:hypothetical protein